MRTHCRLPDSHQSRGNSGGFRGRQALLEGTKRLGECGARRTRQERRNGRECEYQKGMNTKTASICWTWIESITNLIGWRSNENSFFRRPSSSVGFAPFCFKKSIVAMPLTKLQNVFQEKNGISALLNAASWRISGCIKDINSCKIIKIVIMKSFTVNFNSGSCQISGRLCTHSSTYVLLSASCWRTLQSTGEKRIAEVL